MTADTILARLEQLADPKRAKILQGFFKTGPGQYGEGDVFLGITVPVQRKLAKEYQELPLGEVRRLLKSPIHESRLLALLILVRQYAQGNEAGKQQIYDLYLKSTRSINNWDLVDLSADRIVGSHLAERNKQPLYSLAKSSLLWDRRIAILATFHDIKRGESATTLKIAAMLLGDKEDLIHKAVGWMLREVGKRDQRVEECFLRQHYPRMPRTMLRYAIERFPKPLREGYLKGTIPTRASDDPNAC